MIFTGVARSSTNWHVRGRHQPLNDEANSYLCLSSKGKSFEAIYGKPHNFAAGNSNSRRKKVPCQRCTLRQPNYGTFVSWHAWPGRELEKFIIELRRYGVEVIALIVSDARKPASGGASFLCEVSMPDGDTPRRSSRKRNQTISCRRWKRSLHRTLMELEEEDIWIPTPVPPADDEP